MAKKILILLLLTSKPSFSTTLFMPDSDTALLFEIVTTTVAQLNELERLVSNAQKLTGTIQKYNEVVIDHWYRAQRVAFLVEDLNTLASTEVSNLSELNHAVRELKNNIQALEDIMVAYGVLRIQNKKMSKAAVEDDLKIIKEKMLADIQIKRAHSLRNLGNIHKLNAQINADSNKHLLDLKSKLNQQIKVMSQKNEVDAMEKEREIKKRMKIKKFYDMK